MKRTTGRIANGAPIVTERQGQMLLVINGEEPTTSRDVGWAMGGVTTNAANDAITALERKGLVARERLKGRTIHLTDLGHTFAGLIFQIEGVV